MADLFDAIKAKGSFNTFVGGLEKAGLVETLKGAGPLTLFVPTDAAFTQIDPQKREELFTNEEKLTKVMRYHIVSGLYTTNDLLDRLFLKTLEGQRLRIDSLIAALPEREMVAIGTDEYRFMIEDQVTIAIQQSITINKALIVQANQHTDNGVFHVIDHVLLPRLLKL
jgi:uncharacterized surface protein with fasciclin (FAS1) repeats